MLNRKTLARGAVPIVLLIALVAYCNHNWYETTAEMSRTDQVGQIPFDPDEWASSSPIENGRTVRSQMVEDLIKSKLSTRMSRAEVVDLLGEPGARREDVMYGEWDLVYPIGLERAGIWSLDDEFLVFKLDSEGRVREFRTA